MANALATLSEQDNAVRELILQAIEIIRSDDFAPYFDLFTPDAVWMMPSNKQDVGLAEARTFYRFTTRFRFDQQVSVDELHVHGEHAWARLTFDGYLRAKRDPAAAPLRSISRHIWIMQRQSDGAWKITRDIWNNPR